MAYTSTPWAMQSLLVVALLHVSGAQEASLADQDDSFQKLTKAYQGLLEFNHEIEGKHKHHHLRHYHRRHAREQPNNNEQLEAKAEKVSSDLKETVAEAIHHVKDGVVLKRDIAQEGVRVRIDEKKIRKYEGEAEHISETKESLVAGLHSMLDARIEIAQKRLVKREEVLDRNAEAVREWKNKAEELKEVSKEKIKEKHAVKQALLEIEEEEEKLKNKEAEMRRKLQRKTAEASEKVQSFQYAETRYQAQVAHHKHAEEAVRVAKGTLNQLTGTFERESHKVEESLDIRKVQLNRKIEAVEQDKEKNSEELHALKGKFKEWRQDTLQEKAEIEKKRREQEYASEAAAEQKRKLKEAGWTPAKHRHSHFTAADPGDWDSWGSGNTDSDAINTD